MSDKRQLIRLLAAAVAAFVGSLFVLGYNAVQMNNAQWQGIRDLPAFTDLYATLSPYGVAVPVLLLVAGFVCRRLFARDAIYVSVISSLAWLYGLAWPLGCIFAWELPHMIIGTGLE